MPKASREFQVFAKPAGSLCNLDCQYCYYVRKRDLYPEDDSSRMAESILEDYIFQHIAAAPGPVVHFSWHGGEPLILGLDYFRTIVALQRRHQRPNQRIVNGIQTNGTLLDDAWCRFLAAEGFGVGLSLDGPQQVHDRYRITKGGNPTHREAMQGYRLLRQHHVPCDVLCVVHAKNVHHPIEVYRFFKEIQAPSIGFLPLVEPQQDEESGVSCRTAPAEALGHFLCAIFDEWKSRDIERVRVQVFDEAARTAFGQEQALCVFRKVCGDVPVLEHNGDFFSCDHFVDSAHRMGNIREIPLVDLIESPEQREFGLAKWNTLPRYCRACEVLEMCYGGCPKDRIRQTPDGESGLNYLCPAYKRFFNHCRPFVAELSAVWRSERVERRNPPEEVRATQTGRRAGRNDPCPCGSGLKYKKCCLGK